MLFRTLVAAPFLPGLTFSEIARMSLPPLDKNCRLFLWRGHVSRAHGIAEAWGFKPIDELIWFRGHRCQNCNGMALPGCSRCQGEGWVGKHESGPMRSLHRSCLVAERGKPQRHAWNTARSVIVSSSSNPKILPEKFFLFVEQHSEGPYAQIDLPERDGWTTWKN